MNETDKGVCYSTSISSGERKCAHKTAWVMRSLLLQATYGSGAPGSQGCLKNSEMSQLSFPSVFTWEVTCYVAVAGASSFLSISELTAKSLRLPSQPLALAEMKNPRLVRLSYDPVYGRSFVPSAQVKRVNYFPLLQLTMLNARERAELKSMNYCSKQHSGIEKAHFWQDKKFEISCGKKKEHIDLELPYFILTVLQPFVLITAFYFNSCQLEHYMYVPSQITYFSAPQTTTSQLFPSS